MNDILRHRIAVCLNIIKNFENDFEKAFPIGTVRVWDGIEYRKENNGEWVRIKKDKQREVSVSSVIKRLKEEKEEKINKKTLFEQDFEKILKSEFEKNNPKFKGLDSGMTYKILFTKYKQERKTDEYTIQIQKLTEDIRDINEEINELNKIYEKDRIKKIEEKSGKKYIKVDDIKSIIESEIPSHFIDYI